jgi:hypothetical protein
MLIVKFFVIVVVVVVVDKLIHDGQMVKYSYRYRVDIFLAILDSFLF